MLIGCCTGKAEDLALLSQAGYDYFEFSAARLAAMSEEEMEGLGLAMLRAGLPCLGLNSYCAGRPAMVGPDFDAAEAERYALLVCDRAAKLGVRCIGIGAPKARLLPPDYPRTRAEAQMREFLGITAGVAGQYGIYLALETLNDQVCNFLHTTDEALELLREARLDGVGLVLDFYHMALMGEGAEQIPKAAPLLLHTHVSSCGPNGERSFPLMDELAYYRQIMQALWDVGYDASMSIEPQAVEPDKLAESLRMLRRAAGEF